MTPKPASGNDLLVASVIVAGTYAAMFATDKVVDRLYKFQHKRRVIKEVRAWSETWKDINNLPEVQED